MPAADPKAPTTAVVGPPVPPASGEDDYSDILAMLDDDEQAGTAVPAPAPEAASAPDGESFFTPTGEGDEDPNATGSQAPAPAESAGHAPASTPATTSPAELKSVLDLSQRLAAITEANERRRIEEAEERERARVEKEEADRAAERSKPLYDEDLGLTDDERIAYKDALPVLNKVARSVAQDLYSRAVVPLREQLASLQNHSRSSDQTAATNRAENFVAALRGAVPDLNQRTADPRWQAYLQEAVSVPGMGRIPRAQAIQIATERSDLPYVVDQVKSFRGQADPRPAAPQSPGSGQSASTQTQRQPHARKYSYKKSVANLTAMSTQVQRGKLPLDKYEAALDAFEKAMADGLVDMAS